ncbi:MAG: gamma-glutamylcyclotransferase [Mesorhizobium sp.]|nr:gamma-glutamylcyclotransferase [Mesorhizobium sp.]
MPAAKPVRQMRLTAEHVARLAKDIADPGFQQLPGYVQATEADYERTVAGIMAGAPADDFWVFAYGSLIWNPCFDFAEKRVALARGWRRSFCLGWDYRYRGSAETPGLMLALDRGGQCKGLAYRLPADAIKANMDQLIRREMSMVPSAFPARWIKVDTADGPLRALTFAINRNSGRYIGDLDADRTADMLATARGFRGSMAEYLFSTVAHLEEMGIHDRHLWRLQELTAERIERGLSS